MVGIGARFTYFQKQLIKQLVLEAEVQRFNEEETMAYVKSHLKEEVSPRHIYTVKRNLKQNAAQQLNQMRKHKTAFIDELFFKRVNELKKYQKELWRIYHTNARNGVLQKDCIKELHQLSVTLANLYELLPSVSGLTFFAQGGAYNGEKNISQVIDSQQQPAGKEEQQQDDYEPVV